MQEDLSTGSCRVIVRFVRIRCLIWFDGNFLPVGGMVAKVEDNWRGGAGQSTEKKFDKC